MSQSKSPLLVRQPGMAVAAALLAAALAGCGGSGSPSAGGGGGRTSAPTPAGGTRQNAATQSPVPAENNPPGDIPDTTPYLIYRSPARPPVLKGPEGLSRQSAPT